MQVGNSNMFIQPQRYNELISEMDFGDGT
jgi:hypothetical protein